MNKPASALAAVSLLLISGLAGCVSTPLAGNASSQPAGRNPLVHDVFTADPSALVYKGTVYLYAGHDEARGDEMFAMNDWLAYSSRDMKTWTPQGPIMKATDFKWATKDAWAAQVIEKGGKFYFYATVQHDDTDDGKAIGVAVSDSPAGPFADARGAALVTNSMTPNGRRPWEDIDPTVFTDTDGTTWLMWGNGDCYLAKLKPNMVELDGPILNVTPPNYTEGPWLYKHGNLYYNVYASIDEKTGGAESIAYATAPQITGPWTYRGVITGPGANSYTIHPAVVDFKGQSYFFYHDASQTIGGEAGAIGRRSVRLEYLFYNADGTIKPIRQTPEGVSLPPRP